jgi:phosphohistidine phosphatase
MIPKSGNSFSEKIMLKPRGPAMRRLMLLRHAKSDWSQPGQCDHDRALNPRGRRAAVRMGPFLAGQGLIPDCVRVSTARRTRDTWSRVAKALPQAAEAVFDARLYEAAPDDILDVIRETPAACRALLVVGHNPGLQELALLLAREGAAGALERLADKFPTAGLAVIDIGTDDWAKLQPRSGRLSLFATPRGLDETP